jgi:glycosyltransferase involved in cell wall biosynthesis
MKDFDIVHIHDFRTLLSIACHHYSALDKVPYVIQPHGSITPFFEKKKLKKIYDALWGSMILRDASRVISVSNKEAEQCKEMGVKSDRIRIIPNGIDFSRLLNREAVEGKSFREKNDIPDNAKVVLFLGRIHPAKRIELLIDAFSLLINEMNDLILLIVGPDGGGMQPLQEKIRNLGITDRVRFSDYVDNVGDVYLSADVLVNPPNTEIFGFVPFEALMCGTPIIVAKGSGTSEILSEANSGCVVDCKNASELKNTIRYVLEHPDESKELAEIGRRYVLRNFAFESVAERVEKVYEECLK